MIRLVHCFVALAAVALQGCDEDPSPRQPQSATVTLSNGVKMPMLAAGQAFGHRSLKQQAFKKYK